MSLLPFLCISLFPQVAASDDDDYFEAGRRWCPRSDDHSEATFTVLHVVSAVDLTHIQRSIFPASLSHEAWSIAMVGSRGFVPKMVTGN